MKKRKDRVVKRIVFIMKTGKRIGFSELTGLQEQISDDEEPLRMYAKVAMSVDKWIADYELVEVKGE